MLPVYEFGMPVVVIHSTVLLVLRVGALILIIYHIFLVVTEAGIILPLLLLSVVPLQLLVLLYRPLLSSDRGC